MTIKKLLGIAAVAAMFAVPVFEKEAEAGYGRRVARQAVRSYTGNYYRAPAYGYRTSPYYNYGSSYRYGNPGYGYGVPNYRYGGYPGSYYGRPGVSIGIGNGWGSPFYGSGVGIGIGGPGIRF